MHKFDTNFKFVTILGRKYEILDADTIIAVGETDKTASIKHFQFAWENINEISYSKD